MAAHLTTTLAMADASVVALWISETGLCESGSGSRGCDRDNGDRGIGCDISTLISATPLGEDKLLHSLNSVQATALASTCGGKGSGLCWNLLAVGLRLEWEVPAIYSSRGELLWAGLPLVEESPRVISVPLVLLTLAARSTHY